MMRIKQSVLVSADAGTSSTSKDVALRPKREMTIQERKDACKALEYSGTVTELVGDLAGDIAELPIIGEAAKLFTTGISIVSHITKAGMDITSTTLECDDVNFDEIKEILDERFNEVDRKLDKNTEALEEVSKLVSKTLSAVELTRRQMKEGFDKIVNTIKSQEVKTVINQIYTIVQYFEKEKKKIRGLPQDRYVVNLKESDGILAYLRKMRLPNENSLHSEIYKILDKNNNFAIPTSADDSTAFQALYALFYGTQTYISIMFFLLEKHSYLADYNYQKGDMDAFNKEFDVLTTIFEDFKSSLTNGSGDNGAIDEVLNVLKNVKSLDFIKDVKNSLYQDVLEREQTLRNLEKEIRQMELPIIMETPKAANQISFKEPVLNTPHGEWEDRIKVRYAIQLRSNGQYSKLSEWSEPITIQGKANPTLKFAVDEKRRDRLVFRKFNDDKPQLVGVMSKSQTDFKDINRDLYNAAGRADKDLGLKEANELIENGADINAVFEMGRSVLHAAAKSGNNKVALRLLINKGLINTNAKDQKGYSPMHIAAEAGQAGFIQLLITQGADVNVQTDSDHFTPLHIAARNGFLKSVKNLIESGNINLNARDKSNFTALHHANLGGSKIVNALISKEGTDVNAKSSLNLTPLHLAVMNGDREVAEALLGSPKINLNEGNNNNMTALHFASMAGDIEMVKLLISQNGIDINARVKENNWTPLYFATYFKKSDGVVELLKDSNTDTSLVASGNITPLHLSVATGQINIVAELLNRKADTESKTDEGFTALHIAAMRLEPDMSTLLLEKGAVISAKSNDGSTPLHLAAKTRRVDTLKNLISKGADLLTTDNDNLYPIQKAIQNNDIEVVRAILDHDPSFVTSQEQPWQKTLQYCMDIMFGDIYDYYANKDSDKYKEFEGMSVLEILEKQGVIDIMRALNDPKEEDNIKKILPAFETMAIYCLKQENGPPENKCKITSRHRRDTPFETLGQEYINGFDASNFLGGRESKILSPKIFDSQNIAFESPKSTGNMEFLQNAIIQSTDTNSMLLLLDFLIRKITNEKYNPNFNAMVSDLEIRADALELTEKFGKLVEAISSVPADELFDLSEIHSKLYKAIKRGDDGNLSNVFCNFLKQMFDQEKLSEILTVLPDSSTELSVPEEIDWEAVKQYVEACLSG